MSYIFSNHAKYKVLKRKIPLDLIDEVFCNPQQKFKKDDLTILQSIVIINKKEYLLRIFVNENEEPNILVTIYLTSKISKYMVMA